MRVRLAHHTHHLTADGAVMVCDTRQSVVHTVYGAHAAALRALLDAVHHAADTDRDGALDVIDTIAADLVAAGLVDQVDGTPVDRRRVIALGTAAIAGIVTLALPTAAHAASVALPAAPTGDEYLGVNPGARSFIVYWEPVPGPFNYAWSVYNMTSGKVLLASGTSSASYFETAVYTYPLGISHLRIEVSSLTNPAVTDSLNYDV